MADTNKIAYFPNSLSTSSSVNVDRTLGCVKRDIAAINSNPAEYHIVFPQIDAPAIVIRYSTETVRNKDYQDFLKDYGNSVTGS